MGNCVSRGMKSASDDEFPEMADLSEFKAAIRVLRGAIFTFSAKRIFIFKGTVQIFDLQFFSSFEPALATDQ